MEYSAELSCRFCYSQFSRTWIRRFRGHSSTFVRASRASPGQRRTRYFCVHLCSPGEHFVLCVTDSTNCRKHPVFPQIFLQN